MTSRASLAFVAVCFGFQAVATAQTPDAELRAVPDRPTFSATAAAVAAGHAQLEAGAEYGSLDSASSLTIPALLRLGAADAFELRLGMPALVLPFGDAPADLGPLELGAKVAGSPNEVVSLGVMPFFDVSSSSGDSTILNQSAFGVMGLWGLRFSDLTIGGNLGATVRRGPQSVAVRDLYTTASLNVGYAFGDFGARADGFSVFGEAEDTAVGALLAVTWSPSATLVIDAYGGHGFAGDVPDLWFGVGATLAK